MVGAGDWREVAIGDIADIVGGATPSTQDPDNFGGDIPWLTPKDLSGPHDRYIAQGARHLSQQGLDSCSAKLLPAGAVLLSTRAPVGYVAIAKNPIATNQGFRSLIVREGVSAEYLYYWLFTHTEELERHASGSTFHELSGSALKSIKLQLPPLGEQRRIAGVLGALDDKIELNRRMAQTLEQIARALFRSWFVDFEPVRAKQAQRWSPGQSLPSLPAQLHQLFPDQLDPSPQGPIPQGWQAATLGEIANAPRRAVKPDEIDPETPYIGLEHMPRRSVTLSEWATAEKVASGKSEFKRGEILFGKLRPYFHKVGVAPLDGICSTDIIVIEPKAPEWAAFALFVVSSDEFVAYANQTSTGTRMPRTNWKAMSAYEIALPPAELADAFGQAVGAMLDWLPEGVHQSQSLALQRDALLPTLAAPSGPNTRNG